MISILICLSYQIQVLFEVKKAPETYGGLAQSQNQIRLIATDSRIVVIVGTLLHIVADIGIVLELDLIVLKKFVALVLFGIGRHLPHKLIFQLQKVQFAVLLILEFLR